MRKIKRVLFFFFSISLFGYMVWPFGPKKISDFSALPQSVKSSLSGDTIEVPTITAYYSNNYRKYVLSYYQLAYQGQTKLPFPPLRLNYPPEEAFTHIKDQTQSTYLEEMVYPLRDTLFVNGLEPFDEETKEPRYAAAGRFFEAGQLWETKVTLRFYPSSTFARIIVWASIVVSMIIINKVIFKVLKDD